MATTLGCDLGDKTSHCASSTTMARSLSAALVANDC